ncbi:hypothetical protein SARC_10495 [Sphaeroforma arctica JP610]|uniref:Enoyl reductase (ER) domain-containing protein n=1 Tax=Sphaeroforma arctica JP610 TaxID=667725 RepID=A0A0L0FJS8_9EUKA|nr:hypothetical protein SARC_10495 [Sphaeroforma arctica JP610]KNC77032.1 hypothetical protein SARC_10495 [Sphaeroforma arctica JP610]|eukprot:XP_014150934.1 hypothetical protein SARC_10495 [Sphaeroforma arctica JP610]
MQTPLHDLVIPQVCKAAFYEKTRAPADVDSVQFLDVPVIQPLEGQVIVKMRYSSLNPVDWKLMSGAPPGWGHDLPFVLGYDVAGTVVALGEGVTHLRVGHEVFGVNWGDGSHKVEGGPSGGCFKEYATMSAKVLSLRPPELWAVKAAAVSLAGTTAYQAVAQHMDVKKKDKVLILGGSGAVGQLAIQMAKELGAWVATTCSSRTADFVKKIAQPDLIIDYNEQNWYKMQELDNLDSIFATFGDITTFQHAEYKLKDEGRYVSNSDCDAPVALIPKDKHLKYHAFFCLSNNTEHQDVLANLIVGGKLNQVICEEFPFTEAGVKCIIEKQLSNTSMGKNVIKFD